MSYKRNVLKRIWYVQYSLAYLQKCFREGRTKDCFDIFEKQASIANPRFHVRHLLDFYRTAVELELAINQFDPIKSCLTCRKQLGEATLKLQKLKALHYYDIDTAMYTFLGDVQVNVLRGDVEEVNFTSIHNLMVAGPSTRKAKVPEVK